MQVPLEVTFDGISHSQWVEDYIRERADRLDAMCDNLTSCRVVVERAQHHHHTGNPFRARVEVTLPPKKDLVADKEGTVGDPHVQLRPVIRKAFEAVEKQLKKQTERRRGAVKHHEQQENRALVAKLFPEQGYGFLRSPADGAEYFFHRNAVLHGGFERLQPGTEVRFEPEMGEDGPQASTVQIINKPGARADVEEDLNEPPTTS